MLALSLSILMLVACPKKPVDEAPPLLPPEVAPEAPSKPSLPPPVAEMVRNFSRVFFDFDASSLTAEGKSALDANAAIMSQFPDVKLEIQGHADERGTTEYNLALGQKRADSVVQYLLARGIAPSRARSVSYGEERPLDGRSVETAWEQNRRAEFKITWSGDAPVRGTTE
jgi:peptidoglycan-associated lipoprotein